MSEQNPSDATQQRITALWNKAVSELPPENQAAAEKGLGFRRNFRVDLMEALRAGFESYHAASSVEHVNPADPLGIAAAGFQAMMAVRSIMASLCEALSPVVYVTAVILSQSDNGLPEPELKRQVEAFLADPRAAHFAWHLGMTPGFAQRAAEAAAAPRWFDRVLDKLRAEGFAEDHGETVVFKSVNFRIGWSST